jgi:predicted N-acetyltransferase YhbS
MEDHKLECDQYQVGAEFMRANEFTNFTYKTEPYEGWNGDGIVVRAYDGGDEVGHVIFEPTEDDNTQWYAVDVEVEEPYQRKGIATKMYDIAKKSAKQQGAIIVKSHTQTDDGRGLWQDKQVWEQVNEVETNSTTLAQLYNGDYPDRDEAFWDYVSPSEFNTPLAIQTLPRHKVLMTLLGQYRVEHIDEITDMLDDEQQEIVQSYTNDPALSNKVIVLAGHRIIDGNHRALAAAIKGVPINYVDLADLEEQEDIDEAATGPDFTEMVAKLRELGYEHIGSGADARVWAKDDSHVIKILMPDDPRSKAEQVFQKFYEFCQQHPKVSCLPKFNEVNTIEIGGNDYTQIEMEKLSPIPTNTFEEAMVWALSDMVSENLSWETVVQELLNQDSWSGGSTRVMRKMPEFVRQRMNLPGFISTYSQLYEVMRQLYQTGQINRFGWDLHTENVMQRSNGQLVIIDPWFNTNKGSN